MLQMYSNYDLKIKEILFLKFLYICAKKFKYKNEKNSLISIYGSTTFFLW